MSAIVAAASAAGSVASALVSYYNGKRQVDGAQATAEKQIAAAHASAQLQIESAQTVAHKQLVAPMREAWVTKLRERLAEYISGSGQINAGSPIPERLGFVRHEIGLMLDRDHSAHVELETALDELLRAVIARPEDQPRFARAMDRARALSNAVVHAEWQRAKAGE